MATTAESVLAHREQQTSHGFGVTDLMLIAMATIWGANYSVLKYGTRIFTPLVFNGIRIPLAAAAQLGAACAIRSAPLSASDRIRLVLLGVLGNGAYQLLFILGIARTSVATAALVMAATPAMIAMIGWLSGGERLTWRAWIGIALQLLGMSSVVLGTTGAKEGRDSPLGVLLVLLGGVCWAVYSILIRPYSHRVAPLHLGGYSMLGGALVAVASAIPGAVVLPWRAIPMLAVVAVVLSSLLALVVAYLFWYRGIRVIGPTRTSMYGNLQPLIAMVVAWLLLAEQPTAWQVAGAACIMSGLLLARARSAPQAAAAGNPE